LFPPYDLLCDLLCAQDKKHKVIVTNRSLGAANRWCIQEIQLENEGYFVHIDRRGVQTNSAAAITELCIAGIRSEVDIGVLKAIIEKGVNKQIEIDDKKLFVCAVDTKDSSIEEIQEATESSQRCHEADFNWEGIEAWDDVNNCRVDPQKVYNARLEEIAFFPQNESVQEGEETEMPRHDRESTYRCKMGRHQ
jgi:hypothetical protein